MNALFDSNEIWIRLTAFFGVLFFLMILEILLPRRKKQSLIQRRWFSNLSIVALDTLIIRIIFPLLAIDMAFLSAKNGWGLFNQIEVSYWLATLLGFLILDVIIYLQHVMFHAIPVLWRFHRMHHSDTDFDVTTGVRFHPVEIAISMGIKIGAVVLFGIPALGVLLFEVILNATSMFTHSNIKLPLFFDRITRSLFVTPDMHRVHHSVHPNETNSNFGFNLSIWDRLMGTYKDQPDEGHETMIIGLHQFRDPKYLKLRWMLVIPFLGSIVEYAINTGIFTKKKK